MKKTIFLLSWVLPLMMASCVDLKFDEPPPGGEPVQITPNATLEQVKAFYVPGAFTPIPDSMVIRAIVVADDRSGNFYKTLVIQDETGGIELKVNAIGLFNDFPTGREVFLFCRGLLISDYNGLLQLGGSTYLDNGQTRLGGIEEVLIDKYLIPGKRDQAVTPKTSTIQGLGLGDLSTLVRLEEVEFADDSANEPYADPVNQLSINRNVQDCQGNTIILRSSGYAEFAGVPTPGGKGDLTAVVGVFGGSLQLFIRDTSDVHMEGPRCGQGGPDGLDALNQDFETVGNQQDVQLAGWINTATVGSRVWRGRTFDNNTYVQATAFGDSEPDMQTWLITPAINLSVPKTLQFRSAVAFYTHSSTEVLISTDFNGTDPSTATWIPLTATLAGSGQSNYQWVPSGVLDLSGYSGKGYIAFRYTGSGPGGQTTTFIVDDVVVQNK
ncbi:MAG: choice-of-anchor J domain-containing protein [Saprospiraceae bacterium]|nr:choice-of-anchor J domain-containing protein [Saprospiraceae bacterium]